MSKVLNFQRPTTEGYERNENKEPIIPLRQNPNSMTEEQANQFAKAIDQFAEENKEDEMELLEGDNEPLPEEYLDPSEAQRETVTEVIDPNTGLHCIKEHTPTFTEVDKSLAELLNIDPAELYNIPDSVNDLVIPDEYYVNNIKSSEMIKVNEMDIHSLIPLLKEYRTKPKQDWYAKLPESLRIEINKIAAESQNPDYSFKKLIAKTFMDEIVTSSGADKIIIDFQQQMSKAFDCKDFLTMSLDYAQTGFEKELDEKIAKIDEIIDSEEMKEHRELLEKQKENFVKLKERIRESYMLTDLMKQLKSGKIKVKAKHTDKYGRFCKEFLFKYKNDTPYIIDDITICVPVLIKLLPMFDKYQIGNFIIAFIMQTKNYNSKDAYDHAYMSYFVSNIKKLILEQPDQEHTVFTKVLLSNIYKCICLVNGLEIEYSEEELFEVLSKQIATATVEAQTYRENQINLQEAKAEAARRLEEQRKKAEEEHQVQEEFK